MNDSSSTAAGLITLSVISATFLVLALVGGRDEGPGSSPEAPSQKASPRAEALMQKGTCVACHQVSGVLVGPSYSVVSHRYRQVEREEALTTLVQSVRQGSQGKYGDAAMAPIPPQTLSDEELEELINWILGL